MATNGEEKAVPKYEAIPGPPGYPGIGNLLDLQAEVPVEGFAHLLDVYGPIMKLKIGGADRVFIGSVDLNNEVVDEKRFWKVGRSAFAKKPKDDGEDRAQGLFFASSENEMDWQQAHRILIPAFGPLAIENMFDEMFDIATQLVLKWARMPNAKIQATSDFTRLTLDTIALCTMGDRFNSFYSDEMHPFVDAMTTMLSAMGKQQQISYMFKLLLTNEKDRVKAANDKMREIADELVQHRKDNPTENKDILNAMIYGKDPKTGEKMRDSLISSNMITFLVAGHETTSGLLSFAFYSLLKNPSTYFKAREEVDRVIGRDRITAKHLKDLPYLNAVMRETLRLYPTAPAMTRQIRPDNNEPNPTLGGKYRIDKRTPITCLFPKIHTDPKVFGDDAKEFKPERMMDGKFEKLPEGAWKPFGTGLRACIGRAFAWQEALLITALILQNFDVTMDDSSYELRIKQMLTIKPADFYIRTRLRQGITATALQTSLNAGMDHVALKAATNGATGTEGDKVNLQIFYGSNTGTCEALAQKLSTMAARHGFKASVDTLDSASGRLSSEVPVAILTPSYDGQPPDNGTQFVAWLESMPADKQMEGVHYAVFGCGHSDWTKTYHRIPSLVDDKLEALGGTRITARGQTNTAEGNISGDFDKWAEESFWPAMHKAFGGVADKSKTAPKESKVEISVESRATRLRQDVRPATVVAAHLLTAPGQPEKRHLEVHLPQGMEYRSGDYLAILPLNSESAIQRVTKHFSLPQDASVTVSGAGLDHLPVDTPVSISDLLRSYVELAQPATQDDLKACVAACGSKTDAETIESYRGNYQKEILEKRCSMLELLEKFPSVKVGFEAFLRALPPLKPRYYSISSSPLHDMAICSITYSVISDQALSGQGHFEGVAGAYLSKLEPGDTIQVSVRSTNKSFHLPGDQEKIPIVMFCAGTGLAPFRGFIQERAVQIAASNRPLAPALLFVGCRSQTADRLYAEEMDEWIRSGAVQVKYAFSREPEKSEGCGHLGELFTRNTDTIREQFLAGAKFYVCGSPGAAKEVEVACKSFLQKRLHELGRPSSEEDVVKWFDGMQSERVVADVFR